MTKNYTMYVIAVIMIWIAAIVTLFHFDYSGWAILLFFYGLLIHTRIDENKNRS